MFVHDLMLLVVLCDVTNVQDIQLKCTIMKQHHRGTPFNTEKRRNQRINNIYKAPALPNARLYYSTT